jgi:hypothetical protein
MTPKHPLNEPNDLELHAFLDGELPADRVAQVECRLRVDLSARVVVKAMWCKNRPSWSGSLYPTIVPNPVRWLTACLARRTTRVFQPIG